LFSEKPTKITKIQIFAIFTFKELSIKHHEIVKQFS